MTEEAEGQEGETQEIAGQEAKPTVLEQVVKSLKGQLQDNDLFQLDSLTIPEGIKAGTYMTIVGVLARAGVFQNTDHRGVRLVVEGFGACSLEDTLKMYRDRMNKEARDKKVKKQSPSQSTLTEEQVPTESILDLSEEEVVEVIRQLPLDYLFSCILERVQREVEQQEEVIKSLGADNEDLARQLKEKEGEVARVRQDLVASRVEVIQLRTDLTRAQELRSMPQAPDRIYAEARPVEGGGVQSGGSGPAKGAFRGLRIHRRPLTGHVPSAVVVIKKRNGH